MINNTSTASIVFFLAVGNGEKNRKGCEFAICFSKFVMDTIEVLIAKLFSNEMVEFLPFSCTIIHNLEIIVDKILSKQSLIYLFDHENQY